MKYTIDQIAQFAKNAGFSGQDLVEAIAICYGESSFDSGSYNPEVEAGTPAGEGSVGLWQIYEKAHPEFTGWDLQDPQVNACAASIVKQRQGWNAWSSYKYGSAGYKTGLGLAENWQKANG